MILWMRKAWISISNFRVLEPSLLKEILLKKKKNPCERKPKCSSFQRLTPILVQEDPSHVCVSLQGNLVVTNRKAIQDGVTNERGVYGFYNWKAQPYFQARVSLVVKTM